MFILKQLYLYLKIAYYYCIIMEMIKNLLLFSLSWYNFNILKGCVIYVWENYIYWRV